MEYCFHRSYLRFKHKLVFKIFPLVCIPGVINIILASQPNCYNNEFMGADYILEKESTMIKSTLVSFFFY